MAHSIMVPHVTTIPTGSVVVSQAPIGTPISSRPSSSLPLGYKALNSSVVNNTQVIPGSSIPIQQPGGTSLGGSNPLSGTDQSFTSGFQIPRTQPHTGGQPPFGGKPPFGRQPPFGGKPLFGGKPQFWGKPPFGGKPHATGKPQTRSHHQPSGQNASTMPNLWNIPFLGNPQFSGGNNPQGLQQPHLSQGTNLYPPYGQNVYPPYGKTPNPNYNPQNPSGYLPLAHVSQPSSNHVYFGQQQPYVGGATGYNYPPNLVYRPTGVPMPHQYHPQVNRQLPFLATLDLPDLSRLTNDPILHYPF
jgi:hypothetical protein